MSSTSRSKSIDNIKNELNTILKQLNDMRLEVESLASSLSKHDHLKQEIKTLPTLKLFLSKDIVFPELGDIIKAESVIDFIASEVTKPIISHNNVIVYNIPDKIPIKTVRNSILKAFNLQDTEQFKESERLICALTKFRNGLIVPDKTTNQRLTQKRTLNENKGVEIITNHDALAVGSTDATTLSRVIEYSDLPTKSANLPIIHVVASNNQCRSNDDTMFFSLPLEAYKQIPSYNATALKTLSRLKCLSHLRRTLSLEISIILEFTGVPVVVSHAVNGSWQPLTCTAGHSGFVPQL
ncbi:unnamed protein product [Schistosoma curassoni]|uniref:PK domain-containing protein n=1 Tax=Schistosoma curassoni TaxID=6186 RepID=A0A183JXH1_9TREM|nr:unnamed protein product [Schistosoma curassoni]